MFILLFCIFALYIGWVLTPNSGHYFPLCPYSIIIYLFIGQKEEKKMWEQNLSSWSKLALIQCSLYSSYSFFTSQLIFWG